MSGNESLIRAKKDEYERFSSAMDIHPKWERCWVTGDQEVDWERVIGARGNSDRGFKTILQNIAGDDKMKLRGQ